MKYIIFQEPGGLEFPILFPDLVTHSMIQQSINSVYPGIKAVRAGFCNNLGACWGKSVSLKLNSNMAEDEWLLKRCFET